MNPLSSLDPSGECEAFVLLREFAKDRIVVLTTHRYDSLQADDRILHIVDGELIGDGSHADLLARRAGYFDLVNEQVDEGKRLLRGKAGTSGSDPSR